MEPNDIYALLQRACIALETRGELDIAAHVGHCMALVSTRYGVGVDHLDQE